MVDDSPMLELDGDLKYGKTTKRVLLEKDVESAVCNYARGRYRMKTEKFVSPARRSVPDRIISVSTLRPSGFTFFIEFKAPGKEATPLQKRDHAERRAMGFHVFVVDDIDEGKKIIDAMAAFAAEL